MDERQNAHTGDRPMAHGQRIIVVEDMAVVATDIEYTLIGLGYDVAGVISTGEEAMQRAKELHPDLVLMDINLAGEVDGVEAAEWIRDNLQIPVIFLTAYSDEATLQRAKITEPYGYIVKPINKRELQANIEIALYRSQLTVALKESEERYAAVVQQSAECILLVDVDGRRIIEANPASQKLLGYAAEEMEALTLYDIVAKDSEVIDRQIQEIDQQGKKLIEEGRYRRKDGGLVEVEVSVSKISYGGSQVLCVVSRNISERKQAEMALRSAEEELEQQRALSMRSDRLRSLGEMAAGIAHELSQPLVGVRGLAEHLLLGIERGWELDEKKLEERLTQIVEQADRMVHIINHVRMFSREAGRSDRSPVQVNDVVAAGTELLGAQFRARGIELDCTLGKDLPPVLANPFSLEEVVLNLLSNGRDAVEERVGDQSGWVRVRTVPAMLDESEGVQIEVEDNGTGIAAGIVEQIFDPFFTTKGPDRGTGLGLAISRSLVEQLGGCIEVLSTSDTGTTVAIRLPAGT